MRRCKEQLSMLFIQFTIHCIIRCVKDVHKHKRGLGKLTSDQIFLDNNSHAKISNLEGLRELADNFSLEE